MSIQTKLLNWDGFYAFNGACNQRRDPDDTVSRAQIHLTRLGFYRGPLDGAMNDALKDAIRHFKYFPDKPVARDGENLVYRIGPALNQTQTVQAAHMDKNALQSARKPNDDALDNPTISQLDQMLPDPPAVKAVTADFARTTRFCASRQAFSASELDATLDTEPLAVRIVSVPATFKLYEEFARFAVKLSRFEDMESMLLRIYRNFDASKPDLAPENLVYQEVLFRDDLRALPDAGRSPVLVGNHPKEAADRMRAKRWHKDAFFLMKEHAPYKCRCWVSTEPDTFDPFTEEAKLRRWGAALTTAEPFEFFRTEMMLRELSRSLGPGGADLDKDHSPVASASVVFDQVEKASGGDPIWTVSDSEGVNLMERPCPRHDAKFHEHYASRYFKKPKPPGFVDDLLKDPVNTYLNLWKQRVQDEQFKALYLMETLDEAAKHIQRIRQSLCCGRDCLTEKEIKDQIEVALSAAEDEVLDLGRKKAPYRSTVEFCAALAAAAEWILHYTRTIPEMRHYQLRGKSAEGLPFDLSRCVFPLSHERNVRAAEDPNEPNSYRSLLVTTSESFTCIEIFKGSSPDMGRKETRVKRAIEETNIVLVPSYSPLDEAFFTCTRQVPVFMVGLIDLPYLNADAHRYTPWQFFYHDLFHTISQDVPGRAAPQLWHWMRHHLVEAHLSDPPDKSPTILELTYDDRKNFDFKVGLKCDASGTPANIPFEIARDGFSNLERRELILRAWHKNAEILRSGGSALPSEEYAAAYDIVLFCLLHEPMRAGDDRSPYTRCFFPACPDPEDLLRRTSEAGILSTIQDRAQAKWFGPLPSVVHVCLSLAFDEVKRILASGRLKSTRSIVNNSNTVVRNASAK